MISDQWKGILYFDLKIHNVYFNSKGKYLVKFSIDGSRGDLSKVKLYLNNVKKSIYEHEYTSEPFYQEELDMPCQLRDTQFRFELPEEFSEGEVQLLFKTFQFSDNPLKEPSKCGEGKFLIFPCAAPIQTDQPSTSTDKEKCYYFTTQITLNQLLEDEQVYINIGQVHITVMLEMEEKEGRASDGASLHSHGLVNPSSKFDIHVPNKEDNLDEFDKIYDSKFNSADQSFERNSFSSNAVCSSGNISLYTYPKSSQDAHLAAKDSSLIVSQENVSESADVLSESMVANVDGELANQPSAVQHPNRKPTLLDAGDQSNFMKAWTTSKPSGYGSQSSLSNWDSNQVDSSAAARNVEERAVENSKNEKAIGGTKRKSLDQSEMSRNASISSRRMVKDLPLPSTSQGLPNHHLCGSYLNEVDSYEVVVQVHSACDLPSNSQGRPPQPYVTGQTTDDKQRSGLSQSVTHATLHPTYSPLWEELLVVKVSKENFQTQDLILSLVDHPSKTLITTFKIPLQSLKPFYPFHMELEKVESGAKAKLFITLMLKTDELSLPSFHSEIFGLEVVLRHFTAVLADKCAAPLMAVVRVVPNFTQYRQGYLDSKPRQACIKTKKVKCPSADLSSQLVSIGNEDQDDCVPQITFSGEPSEQPKWEQMFFFHADGSSLFSSFSALVIEYFNTSQVVSFGRWEPRFPIGFSYHNLDHSLRALLHRDNATLGVRIDNVAVLDSQLQSKSGEPVTVNVILRLVTKKRPDHMISSSHYGVLPVVDMASNESDTSFTQDGINNPKKESIASSINRTMPLPMINQNHVNHMSNAANAQRSNPPTEQPGGVNGGLDASTLSVLEQQNKEIGKHRYAMKKMADDIIQLRSEATRLQAANSRLRLEIERRSDSDYLKSLPSQFENTAHAELVQRIVIIKGSLDEQTAINRELRLEMQSLQNQLIKKNEKEKEFYKLQDAHKNQLVLLQKMQERLRRTKTLEETCKKQEKVIIRLEDFLANPKTKEKEMKSEEDQTKTISEALSEENKRIRTKLLNYERTNNVVGDLDRLQVHDKLQRAEGRVAALEKELLENTRRWARDKAELQLKLSETQMSRQSDNWQYPNILQESLGLFDRTPPSSRNPHSHSRRPSPKLSPLNKK